ncbi:Astacin (Peptidase M12A) [Parelaphostrongylus tenuis]|uniref:Metalloendopeptidase n=1 Tax=Parelaphostrongylus tenuis TaxID=148309 RepID=A0AAD5N0X4_PARTN|nr:Astacin (Peptidase M12A) [Parelaphostrongylus tenuis]
MIVLLLACLPNFVISEKSFEEKLEEANQLLGNEPNANDTMEFLKKLHGIEKEIKSELTASTKPNAEMLEAMKKYAAIKKVHINPLGDAIEEVNRNRKIDSALFQGDIILTKEQADEILKGIKKNSNNRDKRQAYRDGKYPNSLWSKGVNYAFHNTTKDKILVVKGEGCWSHLGRINGTQALSLGDGCESVGTAAHEIGHALGLCHTHSRHDRDSFVTVEWQNICMSAMKNPQ